MIRFECTGFEYRPGEPVLADVDLELGAGLTLLVGPNGAGKSTVLKLAAGVERPDSGRVLVTGLDLWGDEVAARRPLAYLPEQPDLSPYATIAEILHLVARLRGAPRARVSEVLREVSLEREAARSVRELSMGQRRRAVLAAAWIGTPRIVLLDEPLDGMDREIRSRILAWLDERARSGAAVVVATHELEPFVALAAHVVAVRAGIVTLHAILPADAVGRAEFVEALARGEAVAPLA